MSPAHLRTREFQKSVASLIFRQNSLLRVGDDRYNEVVYTFAAIWLHCARPLQVPERKDCMMGKMHSLAAVFGLFLCCIVGLACEFAVELFS